MTTDTATLEPLDTPPTGAKDQPISKSYIPELDGVRAIAVLMVVFFHYITSLLKPKMAAMARAADGVYPTDFFGKLTKATQWMWGGVDLFFVLSGFLIAGILIDMVRARRSGDKSGLSLKGFYIRRIFRIFPLFYALILFIYLMRALPGLDVSYMFNTPGTTVWPLFTFFQNYIYASFSLGLSGPNVDVSWSLAVEEQFYLFFPFIVILCRGRLLPLAVVVFAIGAYSVYSRYELNFWMWNYALTHLRLDGLATGILLAIFIRSPLLKPSWSWSGWAAMAIGILTSLSFISGFITHDSYAASGMGEWRTHLELSIMGAALIFMAYRWSGHRATAFLRSRPMRFVGAISYGLYLLHKVTIGLVFLVITGSDRPHLNNMSDFFCVVLAFIFAIILCWASLKFYETPFRNFARKIT